MMSIVLSVFGFFSEEPTSRVEKETKGLGVVEVNMYRQLGIANDPDSQDLIRDKNIGKVNNLQHDKAEVIALVESKRSNLIELKRLVAKEEQSLEKLGDLQQSIVLYKSIITKGMSRSDQQELTLDAIWEVEKEFSEKPQPGSERFKELSQAYQLVHQITVDKSDGFSFDILP